jgi:hypothetical protein
MDNFAYAFAEAFDELTSMYTTQNTAKIYELLNIAWTILGVTIGIVVIIGIFFIRPSVGQVFREVDLSTAALMAVPKTAIENSYGTIRLVMNIQDKKKRAKKTEKAVEKEIRQSQSDVASVHSDVSENQKGATDDDKSSQAGSDMSNNEDDESDSENDMEFMEDNEATTSSTAKLFIRYTARYVTALFLIIGIFTTVTSITYVNSLELIQNGIRADLGMRIAYKALRLGFTSRLLVINDKATYPDIMLVHKKLKKDLKVYTKIQQALLYGDHDFGLEFAELDEKLKAIMYDLDWVGNTESLNGMENTVKGNVMNILAEKKFPISQTHPDYISLSIRIPLMYEAYHHAAEIEDQLLADETHFISLISGIMFGAISASLLLIYFFIFQPLLADLRTEHEKAKRLLYQIPLEAVKINFPLQILLRGEDAARDMFLKDEIPGVTQTKDGQVLLQSQNEPGKKGDPSNRVRAFSGNFETYICTFSHFLCFRL